MKHTALLATLTGAALLLAGCSSTSGTATAASTGSSSSVSSSAAVSAAPSSVMSSSESASSAMSSAALSSAPVSSAPVSSAPMSSAPVSSAPVSSAPAVSGDTSVPASSGTGTAGPTATTTVGDKTGGLDAPSAMWFTAFCGGLAPVVSISSSLSSGGTSADTTAEEKKIVTLFDTLGGSLTKTAATLTKLPPPTFSGGADFAKKVETAFGSAGPAISAQAKKMAADPTAAASGMTGLTDSVTKAVAPLQDLQTLALTPQTQAAIEAIPACKKVQSLAGG